MKSAKETLAQYRLQGFSDELIELLAMEEDDQEFAEALLDALISDQEGDKPIDNIKESVTPESLNSEESDILESEELIKSAYLRSGMTEPTEEYELDNEEKEPVQSEYIPPKLEVIEGGDSDNDEAIIPFTPEYALSKEEREYAIARSIAFFGEVEHEDEISQFYSDNEDNAKESINIEESDDWYIDDVEIAEIGDYEEVEVLNIDIAEIVEVEEEELEEETFNCIDFDSIGRSTPVENNVIDFEQAILDLETSRPAEKEWSLKKSKPEEELETMKIWAKQVEEGLVLSQLDKERLEEQLSNRDETLVLQGTHMEELKTLHASYIEQIAEESRMLAKAEAKIYDLREEADRTEHELLTFGNEIELLHGQLFTANSISSSQSKVILEKDESIQRLSTAYSNLLKKNEEELSSAQLKHGEELRTNTSTIDMMSRTISELQDQLASAHASCHSQSSEFISQSELIDSLSDELSKTLTERDNAIKNTSELERLTEKQGRRIRRLEKIREKIKILEFENNVFKTETVPNLQADKEDLVELASEEYNKVKVLDEIAAKRSRRSSYATTLAAAACLMLVLMPILSWNNIETEKENIKSDYTMQLASAEATNLQLEQELDTMQDQLKSISQDFSQAKESWSTQLSALRLQKERSTQGAQIIQAATGENIDESQFNVVAYNDDLLTEPLNTQAGFESEEQYNGVSGLEEYQTEFAQSQPTQSIELLDGKQVRVRRGEGLSQVLWRVYRNSTPEMVSYISNINKLKKDKHGQPMLNINQKLILPKDVNTAMLNDQGKKPSRM